MGQAVVRGAQTDEAGKPSPSDAAAPLSYGQHRMWLLSELADDPAALNLVMAVRLVGPLNLAALRQAFDDLVARHEVLRSRIAFRGGEPVQLLRPTMSMPFRLVEVDGGPASLTDGLLREEASRPFDLERGPLARVTVLSRGSDDHVVGVAMHHAVTDGWSMALVAREVSALYRAYVGGRPGALRATTTVQYREFVLWQRAQVEASAGAVAEWVGRLTGVTGGALPIVRPHPARRRRSAATWTCTLPPSLTHQLGELRRREGGTLFMLLTTALMVVLHRVDGREDVAVGTLASGRTRPEFESTLGYFGNVLLIRAGIGGTTFREAWRRVREGCVAAYAEQDLPYEVLLERLGPERGAVAEPPFSAMCVMQQPAPTMDLPGLATEPVDVRHRSAQFDLTLEMWERPGGIELAFQYDTEVLDEATVALLGRYVRAVLHAAVSDVDAPCLALDLRLPAHRAATEVAAAGSSTTGAGARGGPQTLVGLFERVVAAAPDAVAVTHGSRSLTYAALNGWVNQVAWQLIDAGVGVEDRVAVAMPRSLESVVALLAVLKAGACYVPLSPTEPAERRERVLADSAAHHVLTCADVQARRAAGRASGNPRRVLSPDNLAYLLYTSGSTGTPKGVLGDHRGIVNRLRWMWHQYPYSDGERAGHRTPLAFVDSLTELLGPLLAGVSVEIIDDDVVIEPGRLAAVLAQAAVTRMSTVPSLLRMLLDGLPDLGGRLPAAGVWVCSGERLPVEVAARFCAALPGYKLLNLYGSTEVAGDATAWEVPVQLAAVSIGHAIANVTAYVAGSEARPASPLVAGELYVGGLAVARGYHRRPAETAARFVPDSAGGRGARAFRTGDRARESASGELHYLGRLDDQLQVRGMRVEPGEVEDGLCAHPAVAASAVVGWPDPTGSTTLAAYVVLRTPCSTSRLLAFLRERLPPHMLPSAVVTVPALPYTTSGKVDRRRLPSPADVPAVAIGPDEAARPPRTAVEHTVADVFAELLPVRWRSVDDDFFALGGHSILGILLVQRIRERCGVDLTMRDVFAARTIAEIAIRVERSDAYVGPATLDTRPDDQYEPFPLTDVQQAYWVGRDPAFMLSSVATHAYFEIDAVELQVDRLEDGLRRLVERHPSLRTVVRSDGTQQVLRDLPRYDLPVVDLRSDDAGRCERRLADVRAEMSHQVLPADRWPLFDIRVSQLPGGRSRLHVSIDALIADNLSVRILMSELATLYDDPRASLNPLRLTFRDCVLADQSARGTARYDSALAYWRQRIPTLPPGPELPLRRSPAELDRPWFRRYPTRLDASAWRNLQAAAASAGLTPSGVLLAAFAEVLTCWSARAHYTVTVTLFSRSHSHEDVHRVVGDFTSLVLLEVDHRQRGSFVERARRLQQRLWEDLDQRAVSGVTVLREWHRLKGALPGPLAPVVFTSNLGFGPEPVAEKRELGQLGFAVTQTPQAHLDHQVSESPEGLTLTWDVVDGLYPPGLVDVMLGTYQQLLTALARDESTWTGPLPELIPAGDRERHARANATAQPRAATDLHSLVAKAALRTPHAVAVVDGAHRLSYHEVASRSARIAHRLMREGVRRGELVGVAARKGWEQVVAVLGISASGAAYVPIDPGLPRSRLAQLREQTKLRIVLCQADLRDRLDGLAGTTRYAVDDDATWAGMPSGWPDTRRDDRQLAYVIFTSGSTGTPKGVMIDHRGAVNTILDINRRFDVGAHDRVLGLSSLGFDLSVYDIFGLMAAGGTLVLPDPDRLRDPGHWVQLVQREGVTVWNTVPALMSLAADHAMKQDRGGLSGLRRVLLSGDWLPLDLPEHLRQLAPEAEIFSLGGATEASIWSVYYPIGDLDPAWVSIPYGQPLANQRVYVLDRDLRPRPDWVRGDLHIGGDGVAIGYWGDAGATALRFGPEPVTGERIYRTGDLARYFPDGNLEFLGREDRQVKINGYRVELGEIEAALARVPGIARCAVAATGQARGEKRLAAYYVADETATIDPAGLREHLRSALPEYLVPPTFTRLTALPLTSNGKVDHAALDDPALVASAPTTTATRVAADHAPTALLKQLAEVWARVLAVAEVGPEDNFFDLGGTSLVALRLIGHLEQAYRVKIPLVRLYQAPTVAALATEIANLSDEIDTDREDLDGEEWGLTPDPDHRYDPFPLTSVQEAYWMGRYRSLPLGGVATYSYVELDVQDLDIARLERAVRVLVTRHDALRTVVQADGRQRVLAEVPAYRVSTTDLRHASSTERLAAIDGLRTQMSHQVRRSDQWPLFDLRATMLDPTRTRLHIGLDLLLVDAFSFRILQRELLALYWQDDADLPKLGCTFRDYVLAQQRLREQTEYQRAEAYWTQRLATLPAGPPLPLRRSMDELTRPSFARLSGAVTSNEWSALKRMAAARNLTPSGLLCAAFVDVLAMWSQRGRFTINVTTFDRRPLHPDVQAIVGDFTSTTLLAVDATASTFAARAGRLQFQLFQDLEHRAFSGVDVLRRLRANPSRRADVLAPVVFTSMLVPEPAVTDSVGWEAEPVFGVSQTPQVLLDHQTYEHDGVLHYTWDYVDDAFPPDMMTAMFDGYGRLLQSLVDDGKYWEVPPAWTP